MMPDTNVTSVWQDVREYVRQIPSNELLAGNTALQGVTADLSPVSEASTHAVGAADSLGFVTQS